MTTKTKYRVGALTASVLAIAGIKAHEGYRAAPYHDVGKVPTVGYGSTRYENGAKVQIGDQPVTRERAESMLRAHVAKDEARLRELLPGVQLSQAEWDVYVDFAYNFGIPAFSKSSIRRELLNGNHTAACRALLKYRFAAGRDCAVRTNGCYGVWQRQLDRYKKCMDANQ